MQPGAILILIPLLAIASAAGILAARLHGMLQETRAKGRHLDQVATARGRSLALAAQELRGIAAGIGTAAPAGPGAEDAAQKLLCLADDLAEAANASQRRTIHEAPALLGPIVDAATSLVDRQIRPATRHWQVDAALRGVTLKADGRALKGALAALLRRAASQSRDGDAIALRWVLASETVAIVVEDEGEGLPAPDLGPDTTAPLPGTRGLDLGLSLARSLAAAHGGDIRLEAAPGIGARAWLTLPRTRLLEAA